MSNRKTSLNSLIFKNLISTTFLLIPAIILLISVLYFFAMEKFANSVSEITTQREINNNESLIIKEAEVISVKLKEIEDTANLLQQANEIYFYNYNRFLKKLDKRNLDEVINTKELYPSFVRDELPTFTIHENGSMYKSNKSGGTLYYSAATKLGKKEYAKAISSEILDSSFAAVVESNDLITQAYLNTWDNMNRIYPYIENPSEQYGATLEMVNHNFYYEADLAHNPEKKPVWTDAYLDPAGQGWMISCVFPVYYNEFLEGVAGIDVTINSFILNLFDNRLPNYTNLFVTSSDGAIIAMNQGMEKIFGLEELKSHKYLTDIDYTVLKPKKFIVTDNMDTKLKRMIGEMFSQKINLSRVESDGKKYLINQLPLKTVDWQLFTLTDEDELLKSIKEQKESFNRVGYFSLLAVVIVYLFFILRLFAKYKVISNRVSQPLKMLSFQTKNVGKKLLDSGLLDSDIEEIDSLNENFKQMASELRERTEEIVQIEVEKQQKIKEAEMYYMNSITDPLTNLYNRLRIEEILEYEINQSERYGHPLSLIFLDIDNFKLINDTYGHDKGDEVLIDIANLLQSNLRDSDSAGRWGGEEFIIVCTDTSLKQGAALAEKLRRIVEEHEFLTGKHTGSFGIAEFKNGDTRRSLVQKADSAMYEAKKTSKNVVMVFYDEEEVQAKEENKKQEKLDKTE